MTKKKKEVPMPKLEKKNHIKKSWWIATLIGLSIIVGVSVWGRSQPKEAIASEYIQKGVVTNYVCKVVGADPDQNMVAVQCLTK